MSVTISQVEMLLSLVLKPFAFYIIKGTTPSDIKSALQQTKIQSTLVISKSKGPSETLRDNRTSTYKICRIEENTS